MKDQEECPYTNGKIISAKQIAKSVVGMVQENKAQKLNAMWIEAAGCTGNIISLMNSENPSLAGILTDLINLTYNNTLMGAEGEYAYERFLATLETDFILLVDGAVSLVDDGFYNVIASYQGKRITAQEAIKQAGQKAKYVIGVGTCACYGGITAAKPNPSQSVSIADFLDRPVIRLPGCPCHPDWVVGTIAHLIGYGIPQLDQESRPMLFYDISIHDTCNRRGYFDRGLFAKKLGEEWCMFKLGCRGPVTKTDCPVRKYNGYVNWPIGNNTCCIGCANQYFPDGMEPFVRF